MSVFISTGEVSGDIYAAKLCESLRRFLPEEEFWGMGGALAKGMCLEWDNSALRIMGLSKVLRSLPELLRLRAGLAGAVMKRKPKAVMVFDSPDFHIPLLARIRSLGYKGPIVYVCPPTIWAWRRGRARSLRRYCDLCLPLFGFEDVVLKSNDVKSFWTGHPLLDEFSGYAPELLPRRNNDGSLSPDERLPRDSRRVALLPGSRRSEVRALLPLFVETAEGLREMGLHPVFSVAPGLDAESRELVLNNGCAPAVGIRGAALMAQSRFVVGASGTTAVEAMLLDKFMVVVYKGTPLEWGIYKMVTNIPLISIPNILAGCELYPELLQKDATTENVMAWAQKYLNDADYRCELHRQLAQNRTKLGESGAIGRWAEEIAKLVNRA